MAISKERWTAPQLALAVLVISLCGAVLLSKVHYSGAWDGDPSIHARHAMETVNVFVAEWQSGGDPSKAFLHSYFAFPKMAHEIMLAGFALALNGVRSIDFGEIEFYGAWFATIWTIVGLVAIYQFTRAVTQREVALLTILFIAFSSYILIHANYPRHNMPGHALVWIASVLYIYWRIRQDYLTRRQGFVLGLLFGFAIPVHYTAIYWAFWLVTAEAALLLWDRKHWKSTALAFVAFGAGTLVVPALLEVYFKLYIYLYPEERDWWGNIIANRKYSFVDGMLTTMDNVLWSKIYTHKIVGRDLLYLPGFFWHSFGPVGLLLLTVGAAVSIQRFLAHRIEAPTPEARANAIVLSGLAVTVVFSLDAFQNARKLVPYYPVWAVLIAFGLAWGFGRLRAVTLAWRPDFKPIAMSAVLTLVGAAVLAAHFAAIYEPAREAYHARRDVGYMRAYLAEKGIERILVMPQYVDAQLAPDQRPMHMWIPQFRTTVSEADDYDYIVLHGLYRGAHGDALMNCLRDVKPIVSFPNQRVLPMFRYEFPLVEDFMDFDDPLTVSRSLYRWSEVRDACLEELIRAKRIVDDRAESHSDS